MVWQEFIQSSSGISSEPSRDPEFVALLRREAEAIVPRRRNHPSLVAWCGGNELADADAPLTEDRSPALAALRDVGFTGMVAVELSRHAHTAHTAVPAAMAHLRSAERSS
jgi:beta-galactosidase/beta-glucuronidase